MRDHASSVLLRALLALAVTALVLGLAHAGISRAGELDRRLHDPEMAPVVRF